MKKRVLLLGRLLITTSLFSSEKNTKELITKSCLIEKSNTIGQPLSIKTRGEFKCIQFNDVCIMLDDNNKKEVIELLKKKNILKD